MITFKVESASRKKPSPDAVLNPTDESWSLGFETLDDLLAFAKHNGCVIIKNDDVDTPILFVNR